MADGDYPPGVPTVSACLRPLTSLRPPSGSQRVCASESRHESRVAWTGERRLMPTAYLGDRRAHLRYEVMGLLSATLLSTERLHVVNLGVSGALVESVLPLRQNAEYRMQLVLENHVSEATVKIRRVTEIGRDAGPPHYRIGLEFLAISPEAEEVITRIVSASQAPL